MCPPPTSRYRAPGALALALVLLLGLDAALAWVAIQASFLVVEFAWHALAGAFVPGAGLGAFRRQLVLLRVVQLLAGVTTLPLLAAWTARMAANLTALGVAGAPTRHHVLAAFLVPWRAPLGVPRQVAAVWGASDPRPSSAGHRRPAVVAWWWGLLLASLVLDGLALLRGVLGAWGPGSGPGWTLVAEGCRVAAAALAIVIVVRVDRFQEERRMAGGRHG